jgi:hypothetical protein
MRSRCKLGMVALSLALGANLASGAELAILRNGFTLRHDHHELRGTVVRLFFTNEADNFADFPVEEICGYEKLETAESIEKKVTKTSAEVAATPLDEIVNAAGKNHRIDPDFIRSIIRVESGFDTRAVSRKGALGLMQLMPQTAKNLGVRDAFDPKANVEGGTRYINGLLAMYNDDPIKALAAYNAGPQRVNQFNGVPPFQETQRYVTRVLSDFRRQKQLKKAVSGNVKEKGSPGVNGGAEGNQQGTRRATTDAP